MSQEKRDKSDQLTDPLEGMSRLLSTSTQDTEAIVQGLFKHLSESVNDTSSTSAKADKVDELTQSKALPSLPRQAIGHLKPPSGHHGVCTQWW